MEINWPVPSFIGEQYTSPNGDVWEWNGYAWESRGGSGGGGGCEIIPISESSIYDILSGNSPVTNLTEGCKYRIYDAGVANGAPGSLTDDGSSGFVTVATSPTSINPNGSWSFVNENYSKMVLEIRVNHDTLGTYPSNSITDIQIDGVSIISTSHTYTPGQGKIQDLLDSISSDINTLVGGTWEAISNSWASFQDPTSSEFTDWGLIYLKSKIAGDRNNLTATFTQGSLLTDPISLTYSTISALGSSVESISLEGNYDYSSKNIVRAYDPLADVEISNDFYAGITNPMIYDFPWRVPLSLTRPGLPVTEQYFEQYLCMSSTFKNCLSNFRENYFNYLKIHESKFSDTSIVSTTETGVSLSILNLDCQISSFDFSEVFNRIGTTIKDSDLGIQLLSSKIKGTSMEFNGLYTNPGSDIYISSSNIENSIIEIGSSGSLSSPSTSKTIFVGSPLYITSSTISLSAIYIKDTLLSNFVTDLSYLKFNNSSITCLGGTGVSNLIIGDGRSGLYMGGISGKGVHYTEINSSTFDLSNIYSLAGRLNIIIEDSHLDKFVFSIAQNVLPSKSLIIRLEGMRILGCNFNGAGNDFRDASTIDITISSSETTASEWTDVDFLFNGLTITPGSLTCLNIFANNTRFFNSSINLSEMVLDLPSTEAGFSFIDLSESDLFSSSFNLSQAFLQSTGTRNSIYLRSVMKYSTVKASKVTIKNSGFTVGDNTGYCYLDSSLFSMTSNFLNSISIMSECKLNNSSIVFPSGDIDGKKWTFTNNVIDHTVFNMVNGTNATDWTVTNCNFFNAGPYKEEVIPIGGSLILSDSTTNSAAVIWNKMMINYNEVTINILVQGFTSAALGTKNTKFYVPSLFVIQRIIPGNELQWGGSPSPTTSPVSLALDSSGIFSNDIQEDSFFATGSPIKDASFLRKSQASECEYITFSSTSEVTKSDLNFIIKGILVSG